MFSIIPLTVTRLSYRQSMYRATVMRHVFYYSSVRHKTVLTTVNVSRDSHETCFLFFLCHKTVLTTVNVSRDSRETCFLVFLCHKTVLTTVNVSRDSRE